jgi:transcriptional regulator with XRE-family HTH domain
MARIAGVSQQAVSAYETGRKEPTIPTLQRLLSAAGYEMRIRLEETDDHDRSLDLFMESLSPATRASLERRQRQRVEASRLSRIRGH